MSDSHRVCLCLGSNIEPELHLREAVGLLAEHGRIVAISTAWESPAVGANAPNFLNACVLFITPLTPASLVKEVIRPIESSLGRTRTQDKNAARPIDIDIVLYDDQPLRLEYWDQAFMIVPLAELLPDFVHPVAHEKLTRVAGRMRAQNWIIPRPAILSGLPAQPGTRSNP